MGISRRQMMQRSSLAVLGGGVAASAGAANAKMAQLAPELEAAQKSILIVDERAQDAYKRRVVAAGKHLLDSVGRPDQALNSDEDTLPGFVGNFSKTLPHNSLGEVEPSAYMAMVNALETNDYSGVQLSSQAERKLANPSAFNAFDIHGSDAHYTRIDASPSLTSAHAATEMIEVYWQALTRDVKYSDYDSNPLIADAVTDLNAASVRIGPLVGGNVNTDTVFRGSTFGDIDGPYISQLLYQPFNYGAGVIDQRYAQPVAGNDFMTDFSEYLAIQNGALPTRSDTFSQGNRYIQTARDLANYVHNDVLFQAYYNAAMILLGKGGSILKDENPFRDSVVEGGFVTFGGPDVLNMVAQAARMALTGAWYQKWLQRKLRPEAFGARVDVQRRALSDYGIHPDLMASEAVARTVGKQGNALLSQAFPEGSPTHPAYPAGHACVAGACATVLKAWFKEDATFTGAKVPSSNGMSLIDYAGPALTVGGEINKLANNISIGRNAAGVHYRTDGEQGMLAGEQQAIGLLKDYSLSYTTAFDGFTLTKFDGTPILIANGSVIEL